MSSEAIVILAVHVVCLLLMVGKTLVVIRNREHLRWRDAGAVTAYVVYHWSIPFWLPNV